MQRIERAAQLFEDFTGHQARRVRHVKTRDHDTVLAVGPAEAVAYNAVRDGKRESYIHEFRKGSRPLLAVSDDGSQLYLLGGAYRFTDRGIEDRRKMAHIAVVNPSRRKGRKMSRRGRTAKQQAATRKLLAWNRAHRVRKGPAKSKSARYINPHRRRARGRRRSNPVFASRRRSSAHRRRNPISMAGLMPMVIGGATGAAGAIAADLAIGYLPLPAMLQSGILRQVTRLGVVIGLGAAVGKFASRQIGEHLAVGGATAVLYDMIKGLLVSQFPTLPLQPVATVVLPTTTPAAAATPGTAGWISPAPMLSDYAGTYSGEADFNYDGMGAYVDGMGDVGGGNPVFGNALGSYVSGVEVRAF
jgi:hypothetical protein